MRWRTVTDILGILFHYNFVSDLLHRVIVLHFEENRIIIRCISEVVDDVDVQM